MRDANRIVPILEEINKLWHRYPDFRFYQLLIMVSEYIDEPKPYDLFFLEDDRLMKALKRVTDPTRETEENL